MCNYTIADPYLDGEFVSRYLPCVPHGVAVRLLVARKSLPKLLAAVGVYRQETALSVEVRSYEQFHDRYLFVDRAVCYQSGASFKDGAKNDPTTLIQVSDAFASVAKTYEAMWAVAIVHP